MEKYDVVVVGSGTGGCTAAKTATSAGLSVCLVERKESPSIGDKVCGDAIGQHHFDNLGLAYPKGEELERNIAGISVHSPDLKTVFRLVGEGLPGFIVNRRLFGQRLLKDALDAGAVLFDSRQVLEPIIEDGYVRGIVARNLKTGSTDEFRGKATVDASGLAAVLRSRLPPEFGIETSIAKEDLQICYREIRELKVGMEELGLCEIRLSMKAAPGGYYWVFPEAGTKVNVGLGVAAVEGFPNPKTQLYKHVLSQPLFEGSKTLHGGGGTVPTRRPLDSFVGNGIVVIGDATCMVNPIHGGGIGPSMLGGKIAGEVITQALEKGEPSRELLWPANTRYIRTYGAKQSGLDVFRLFLQGLKDEDLDYGMAYRLIKEEDILRTSMNGSVKLNVSDATRRIFMGLGRLSFLRRLYSMAKNVKKAKALYLQYPESPHGMPEWRANVEALFTETRKIFIPA